MNQRHPSLWQRGFTLIELIITIVLIGLLAAVGTSMIFNSFETTYLVDAAEANNARARNAMERLEREIREINYAGTGYQITMGPSTLAFTKSDGQIVTIDRDASNNLRLCFGALPCASPITLAEGATTFALTYHRIDTDGNTTTDGVDNTNLRFVEISLTLTDARSGQSLAQRSRVALRNNL